MIRIKLGLGYPVLGFHGNSVPHGRAHVKSRTGAFFEEKYALQHFNYDDVDHFVTKLNHYTSIQAKERTEIKDFSSAVVLEKFAGEFAKRALMMDGVEEGMHGVALSLLQAMYEAVIYLKQWGNQGFKVTKPEDLGKSLQQMQRIWHYWWADYQVRHTGGFRKIYWQIRRKFQM